MNINISSRRDFLAQTALASMAALLPLTSVFAQTTTVSPKVDLAAQAFLWGLPLFLTGRYLKIAAERGADFNRFYLNPKLSTPDSHVAGPNIDTLYGFGWIDLTKGPQVVTVPEVIDRYYSLQLIDVYGHVFNYIGSRVTGSKAGAYAITPPGYTGVLPAGVTEIKAPSDIIEILVRTEVKGYAEQHVAHAVQSQFAIGALADYPNGAVPGITQAEAVNVFPILDLSKVGAEFFTELDALVRRYPPLEWDKPSLARFAPLGLGAGGGLRLATEELTAAAQEGLRRLHAYPGENWVHNGWHCNLKVEPFIKDPIARAAINRFGAGAHVAEEALYFSARRGPDAQPLHGAKKYRLHFAPGQTPPVDFFWSLTLYDHNFWLVANEIDRYGITDRLDGLRWGDDGSLTILIQNEKPSDAKVNWLPAPLEGFHVILRTYGPKSQVLAKTYQLPQLEIIS